MPHPINGLYDSGKKSDSDYTLEIDFSRETDGYWSGYLHVTALGERQQVSGNYHFYRDERKETVLEFSSIAGHWRLEADFVEDSPSFKQWHATLNGVEINTFYQR